LAFNQGCRALVPRAPLDVRFFAYQLLVMRPDLEAAGAGSTFKELSSDALAETRVFRPALDEQQRIAEYLDVETTRIDRLISANARLSALVSERWQATLASAVTGQTGGRSTKATGNPFLPTVAADWRVCRLKHLASRVDVGIAEAATHAYADQGVPLLRSMNIRPNRLDTSDVLFIDPLFDARNHRKRVKANDILTVRTGNAGVSAVAPEKLAGCQTFTQLITSLLPEFSAPFVCFYLNSEMARRYFDTTGWGSAQRNISVPILANTPMPCPPGDEQSRIAAYLVKEIAEVDGLLAAIKRRTDLAVERRSALVAAAVSGNLDVTTARGAA
jgi:type I restriction enzyme S subunit